MNLLQETLGVLTANGKTHKDVVFVGDGERYTTWEDFVSVANVEYDDSYGINEVHDNLVVVGDGWWLERGEYDEKFTRVS